MASVMGLQLLELRHDVGARLVSFREVDQGHLVLLQAGQGPHPLGGAGVQVVAGDEGLDARMPVVARRSGGLPHALPRHLGLRNTPGTG